jgi:hypothetical protein
MIIRKGFVNQKKMWNFVKNFENKLNNEKWNGKENNSGRRCLWLGLGVELGFNCSVFKGEEINNGLRIKCNELWGGEDWNSILLYKYDKGVELKNHVDRDIFNDRVVVINVCKCENDLFGGSVNFFYDGKIEILKDGEIIEFNNKKIHGVRKVKSERWSLSIRKVL